MKYKDTFFFLHNSLFSERFFHILSSTYNTLCYKYIQSTTPREAYPYYYCDGFQPLLVENIVKLPQSILSNSSTFAFAK